MVPDRQKVWTDGMDGRTDRQTHGRYQNYIPPTSSGDNNMFCVCTEVLWGKMVHLLSNKITPHFQLLPMSKVDQS